MGTKINDFSLHIATENGSGSQSSNNVLLRSIFRMGIPVSGKNLFPSNIQGLPTWFTIRVNEEAWTARVDENDLVVCMNDATYVEDVRALKSGSVVIHHDHMPVAKMRSDVTSIAVPFKKIVAEACSVAKLRKLVVNMVYVGVIAELIGIEDAAISLAMKQQFKNKAKAIDLNTAAIKAGRNFVQNDLSDEVRSQVKLRVEPRNKTDGQILIDGNTASGLGSVFAGASFLSWYPITPSSSLAESFQEYAERFRKTSEGKRKFAVVQAEDELAAIGMLLGAGWMGARAMTATSGPGLSLMAEWAGFGYYAEIPGVIFDVQRVGPSTGLPTRTSQADVQFAALLGHGDTKNICLYPATVEECFEFAGEAFDLAEGFQTPVFVLSDLDLGMNFWMSRPFEYPTKELNRGKVLTDADTEKLENFGRYKDVDGDGVTYRTLPGIKNPKGVFFTRGTGRDEYARYSESPEIYKKNLDRLVRKWNTAKTKVPKPILETDHQSSVGVLAYGSSHDGVREAVHLLSKADVKVDYMRLRAYPFTAEVEKFIESHERVYVVEQNRDAQLKNLLCMEESLSAFVPRIKSVLHYTGMPITAKALLDQIINLERECSQNKVA